MAFIDQLCVLGSFPRHTSDASFGTRCLLNGYRSTSRRACGTVTLLLLVATTSTGCSSRNVVVAKIEPIAPATRIAVMAATSGAVCFFPDSPDLRHQVIGRVAATKKTYGGSHELFRPAGNEVRALGGNAVFSWSAAQKFKGPNPFRASAPSGVGVAVLVSESFDCGALGGTSVLPTAGFAS